MQQVLTAALTSFLAGGGLMFYLFKLYFEHKLKQVQERRDAEAERQRRRYINQREYQHALGRTLFWLVRGCKSFEEHEQRHFWNGELQEAHAALEEAERKGKELDREILADQADGQ